MASQSIVIIISGSAAASTSVTFTPAQQTFTAPVAVGTVMGTIKVEPESWSGTIVISGGDQAGSFSLNQVGGEAQLAAARILNEGTYNLTVTASP